MHLPADSQSPSFLSLLLFYTTSSADEDKNTTLSVALSSVGSAIIIHCQQSNWSLSTQLLSPGLWVSPVHLLRYVVLQGIPFHSVQSNDQTVSDSVSSAEWVRSTWSPAPHHNFSVTFNRRGVQKKQKVNVLFTEGQIVFGQTHCVAGPLIPVSTRHGNWPRIRGSADFRWKKKSPPPKIKRSAQIRM